MNGNAAVTSPTGASSALSLSLSLSHSVADRLPVHAVRYISCQLRYSLCWDGTVATVCLMLFESSKQTKQGAATHHPSSRGNRRPFYTLRLLIGRRCYSRGPSTIRNPLRYAYGIPSACRMIALRHASAATINCWRCKCAFEEGRAQLSTFEITHGIQHEHPGGGGGGGGGVL